MDQDSSRESARLDHLRSIAPESSTKQDRQRDPQRNCRECTSRIPPKPGYFSLGSCAKGHDLRDTLIYHKECPDCHCPN